MQIDMIYFTHEAESVREESRHKLPNGVSMVESWRVETLSNSLQDHYHHRRGSTATGRWPNDGGDLRSCLLSRTSSEPGATSRAVTRLLCDQRLSSAEGGQGYCFRSQR